ncbi:MAG: hypothetical protein ACRCY3_10345 [Sphingorhabdus sp.]
MKALLCLLPFTLALAACSSEDEPDKGTTVNIDATGEDGSKVAISADGDTGKVGVKIPGFDANVRLPKKLLDSSEFDIDGVKLYPGSTVETINVKADETAAKGSQANVQIGFSSPAEPAKVADWLKGEFKKQSITIAGDTDTLTGKSKDGEAFTIELAAAEGGKTSGTVAIRE